MSLSKKEFKWTSTNLRMRILAAQIPRVAFLVDKNDMRPQL